MLLILVLSVSVCVHCRGPHHPRGEAVVKHHVHYRPTRGADQKLLDDEDLVHDTAHLEEHLEEVIDKPDLSKMTDEELDFYYFQVHDTDKNAKLDGLEILQAIMHTDHHDENEDRNSNEEEENTAYFIELIDRVLQEDDTDNDGYLSYAEYTTSRRKNASENEPAVRMVP